MRRVSARRLYARITQAVAADPFVLGFLAGLPET